MSSVPVAVMSSPSISLAFTFRRLYDDLIYTFVLSSSPSTIHSRSAIYSRSNNNDVRVQWDDECGWSIRDQESGELLSIAWDMPASRQGDSPSEGIWVSRKGEKSYVYEMKWDDEAGKNVVAEEQR